MSSEGDGLFFAFPSATGALEGCVDAQRALRSYAWPDGAEVRVRMGVHVGEAEPVDGDYIALSVHQAARVSAAGHGGQILATARTVEEAGGRGPAVQDLGRFRLKDFDEPEHLFQVVHPDLDDDFPDPRAPSATESNLPRPRTSFIAGPGVLQKVRSDVLGGRLVTLAGPAGVGKTRMAIEAAADMTPNFPDGMWFVNLAPVDNGDLVPEAVAATLGIESALADPTEGVAARLTGRCLLILDNCEHVIEAAATLADDLLAATTDLTIVATSREPLKVEGERVQRVVPLSLPDRAAGGIEGSQAALLFLDRMAAVRATGDLTDEDVEAVRAVVESLDGIPLGLELAAARCGQMSLPALAVALQDRFAILAGGPRSAESRQRTLEAAIAWSYDLLSPPERDLFVCLAVFAGPFSLDAAAQVCGDDARVGVPSLVDKSLVAPVGRGGSAGYALLESVRAYAAQAAQRDPDRERSMASRHLAWCMDRAKEGAAGDLIEEIWHAIESSIGRGTEVEPAVRLAILASQDLRQRGRYRESRTVMEEVLGHLDSAPRALRAEALRWTAIVLGQVGAYRRAMGLSEEALTLAEAENDLELQARCLNNLGWLASVERDRSRAEDHFRRALGLAERAGVPDVLASSLQHLGLLARRSGDLDDAVAYYERARAIAVEAGDRMMETFLLLRIGGAHFAAGDLVRAREHFEAGERRATEADATDLVTQAVASLAWSDLAEGKDQDAAERFGRILADSEGDEVIGQTGDALLGMSRVARRRGDIDEAASFLQRFLDLTAAVYQGVGAAVLEEVGYLAVAAGHADGARFLGAAEQQRAESDERREVPEQLEWDAAVATLGALPTINEPSEGLRLAVERFVRSLRGG